MKTIKTALISVWDKEGIIDFAKFLNDQGVKIISTGGTKKTLEENSIDVISISSITGQKEVMDGRVKTLHPKIFGGILADRDNNSHLKDLNEMNSLCIDVVVVNLYPFKSKAVDQKLDLKKAIEFIDIGGPSMLRAAAKNHENVIPICKTSDYDFFKEIYLNNNGLINSDYRRDFATKVFKLTNDYDSLIYNYFSDDDSLKIDLYKKENLRYGENPHQSASFYLPQDKSKQWSQLSGKKLSYNNYFDIESAISIVYEFKDIACSIIKHSNPCGFAFGENSKNAYLNAVSVDPVSYFGGIVALNSEVNLDLANELTKSFLECIVAPSFSDDAKEVLIKKKNLRLIEISRDSINENKLSMKSVFNGFLIQDKDSIIDDENNFKIVSKRKPTKNEFKALILGWKLVKYVKSNAIVFSNQSQLLGVGAGQMSRIDSTKIAINKAQEHGLDLKDSIMASDAFFPFPDCVELAFKHGVSGVIHPGGSIKDEEIIKVVDKLNMYMVTTNKRHFLH